MNTQEDETNGPYAEPGGANSGDNGESGQDTAKTGCGDSSDRKDGVAGMAGGMAGELPKRARTQRIPTGKTVVEDNIDDFVSMRAFDLPQDIPEDVRVMMALKAYGMTNREISEKLGIETAIIGTQLRKYNFTQLNDQASLTRKILLSSLFEVTAMECLSRIKKEDIANLNIKDRIGLGLTCIKAMESLRELGVKPIEANKSEGSLIAGLKDMVKAGDSKEPVVKAEQ